MPTIEEKQLLLSFTSLIDVGQYDQAADKLNDIKAILLDYDALPPLNIETADAFEQRVFGLEAIEYMVLFSVGLEDKLSFERNFNSLRPYYFGNFNLPESKHAFTVIGLYLLFLLVENRLADLYSDMELLSDSQIQHPSISFCTQLERFLAIGSYDQVLKAASKPPVPAYSFFLNSLLETVRLNIGECISVSYDKLSISSATKILMFTTNEETSSFIQSNYEDGKVENDLIYFKANKTLKSEEIPNNKLISQTLSYATELERIV